LDDDAEDDDGGGDEHAATTTPGVDGRANERNGYDRADLVHGGNDPCPGTVVLDTEEVLEIAVGEKGPEKGAVVTIGGGAAESDDRDEVEEEGRRAEWGRRLLQESLLKGLISDDDLDLGDILLIRELVT
jgi:hypothetical protein